MAHVNDHNDSTGRAALVPNYPSLNYLNPNLVHNHRPQVLYPVIFSLHPALVAQIYQNRSISLQQLIIDERLVPLQEEEQRRNNVIRKLKEIVMKWIKKVANKRKLPRNHIRAASATILTFGSYGLGVHNAESDIDALCVGPWFASLNEHFFIDLHNMLAKEKQVSDIHCIKDAKVPLMRFKFEGITIDFPYARLKVPTVPENVDILNPFFLNEIDETSWKSLSGVRANNSILQLVPNVRIFQELLRCVKLWAKRRGVYGNLFGYFGGVHLAVLSAYVCQRNPNVCLASLVKIFFKTFAFWKWSKPVALQQGTMLPCHHPETRSLMPIQLPSSPHEYCYSNITTSTCRKIKHEFLRGFHYTEGILKPHFDWRILFEPYPYSKTYHQFVKIKLSSSNKDELRNWVGWVKSRFRCLVVKLEVHGLWDPNPTEYSDTSIEDPHVVYYWGLAVPRSVDDLDLDLVQKEFRKNLGNGFKGVTGRMTLSLIKASELPKNLQHVDARVLDPNPSQIVPVYPNHIPNYSVPFCRPGYCGPRHPGAGFLR